VRQHLVSFTYLPINGIEPGSQTQVVHELVHAEGMIPTKHAIAI